jgi:glycosyltransferase involved in cell wall biosynthesis
MKILFGVPETTHRELADLEILGIKSLGINTDIIHFGSKVQNNNFFLKLKQVLTNALAIRRRLKNEKFDMFFLNSAFDTNALVRDFITLVILNRNYTKVFVKFHGSDLLLLDNLNYIKKTLLNYLFTNVSGVGVLSSEELNSFLNHSYPKGKLFVVKNPINPEIYLKKSLFKDELGISNDSFLFLFCARFIKQKGLIDVLLALRDVVVENKNTHLVAIGDGPEMEVAKQFVEKNQLDQFVTFTGFIPEKQIIPYYSNVDALVFPTYHQEGFPMVVFQSLAAGLPIITTRIRACADYLIEPNNVLWVEAKNIQSIKGAMLRFTNDKLLTAQMGDNNKKLSANFRTEANAKEYADIFENLLKQK